MFTTTNDTIIETDEKGSVLITDTIGETKYESVKAAIADLRKYVEAGAGEWWVDDCNEALEYLESLN